MDGVTPARCGNALFLGHKGDDIISCFHPLLMLPNGIREDGKKTYYFPTGYAGSPLDYKELGAVLVPCGKCIGCRLDYSKRWADRMMLELETQNNLAVFVTLTYCDEELVFAGERPTLVKQHCQGFLKRIRKYYEDYYDGLKLRFYLAGEYGEKLGRPHYHMILYGIDLSYIPDLRFYKKTKQGNCLYISELFNDKWSHGYVVIAPVTWETCAYTSRYVTKKLNGEKAKIYDEIGILPEFSLMSRKPGIGRQYLNEHPDCLDYEYINISTASGGRKISIPKYFIKTLEESDPDRYQRLIDTRISNSFESYKQRLMKTDKSFYEMLEDEETLLGNKTKQLIRGLE